MVLTLYVEHLVLGGTPSGSHHTLDIIFGEAGPESLPVVTLGPLETRDIGVTLQTRAKMRRDDSRSGPLQMIG